MLAELGVQHQELHRVLLPTDVAHTADTHKPHLDLTPTSWRASDLQEVTGAGWAYIR